MIAVNALAQLGALGGIILVQTAYLIVMARVLGAESFGRYSLVLSISQILLIGGDLGLHNTALRRIARSPDNSPHLLSSFLALKIRVSILLFAVSAGVAWWLPAHDQTRVAMLFFGAGLFFHSMTLAFGIGFQAHGKLYLASLASFGLVALHALLGLIGLYQSYGIVILAAAYLVAAIVTLASCSLVFDRTIHPVSWSLRSVESGWWSHSFDVGLGTFFEAVTSKIVITLLSLLAGDFQVGLFAAANRISAALRNLPTAFFGALLPEMASHSTGSARLRTLYWRSLALMLVSGILLAGALVLGSDDLINLLYGPEFMASSVSLQLLALSLIPAFASAAGSSLLLSQGAWVRGFAWINGVKMCVHLVVGVTLIAHRQALGAALAVLLTEALGAALFFWKADRSLRQTLR